jgi:signal transduction histidine kinase
VSLAFVGVTLVLLALVPIVVGARVRRMRQRVTDVTDPARVLINDVQVAITGQIAAIGVVARRDRALGASRYAAELTAESRAEDGLAALAARLGPEARRRIGELRATADRWHDAAARLLTDTGAPAGGASGPAFATDVDAEAPLRVARSLDALLDREAQAQRVQISSVERLDILLPAGLVPLALVSVLIVAWTAARMARIAREAEAGRASLARTMAEKSGLLRGVTHDVKNPLGAAAGYTELLSDGIVGPLSAEQHDVVARVHRLVHIALRTLGDLQELWRAESEPLTVTRERVDLCVIARQCAADYDASARSAELVLVAELPDAPVVSETDERRVRQIVENLLSNAIKYTPSGGRVRIRVRAVDARRVAMEVEDTGPGIPEAYRERVFEEFFRLPGNAGVSGTGVGLAISRRLARALGGDLCVGRGEGTGALLVLELPAG